MIGSRPTSGVRRRGSALVPVLAAMLVLSMCGFALSELTGAQRIGGVLELDAARAYWIADAGLQHAALEDAAIASEVTFAGGGYAVAVAGDVFTATGTWGGATRELSEDWATWADGVPSPIDEAASEVTAYRVDGKKFEVDLISVYPRGAELASFDLSASAATEDVKKLELGGKKVWEETSGVTLPLSGVALNAGNTSERTIGAGLTSPARFEFMANPTGTFTYTLGLYFTDGSTSTLVFSITW